MTMPKSHLAQSALLLLLILLNPLAGHAADVLSELFDKADSKVLSVTAYDQGGARLAQGSGFVIDKKGVVVTNYSTVARADLVELKSSNGEVRYASAVVNVNEEWDVALVQTKRFKGSLALAKPDAAKPGLEIYAMGSPQGFNNTISQGNIMGLLNYAGRSDLIQINNQLDSGAIGGPVLTEDGKVLGVAKSTVQNRRRIFFAVPGDVIKDLLATRGDGPDRDLVISTEKAKQALLLVRNMRANIESQCMEDDIAIIDHVIGNAIASGAGIYNAGHHLGCYRIYEGAGYKILYSLRERCDGATSFLSRALTRASETRNKGRYESVPGNQAWIMRHAFDALMGQRPDRAEPDEDSQVLSPDLSEEEAE